MPKDLDTYHQSLTDGEYDHDPDPPSWYELGSRSYRNTGSRRDARRRSISDHLGDGDVVDVAVVPVDIHLDSLALLYLDRTRQAPQGSSFG